jgi:hypothetical protein
VDSSAVGKITPATKQGFVIIRLVGKYPTNIHDTRISVRTEDKMALFNRRLKLPERASPLAQSAGSPPCFFRPRLEEPTLHFLTGGNFV